MGGKRPDQYNIDPAEGSSTNHSWRHEGRSGDEHITDQDKRRLQENPHDQPMIPETNVNPAMRELREQRERKAAPAPRATPSDSEIEDAVDEASEESFPASDPPPGPGAIGGVDRGRKS